MTITTTCLSRFVPAVVEGGPRRCQGQTLPKLIPLPGHLAELQEDGVQVVAGMSVVINGWGRGGRFAVYRGTYDKKPSTRGVSYSTRTAKYVSDYPIITRRKTLNLAMIFGICHFNFSKTYCAESNA